MGSAIGDIVPFAVTIALSPIPIIAAILMLLSPQGRGTSVGFLLGWVAGIVAGVVVFTLLAGLIPAAGPRASKPIAGTITIMLGLLLLLLALRRWRPRRTTEDAGRLPTWMHTVDSMGAGRGFALGFFLAAVNNLPLSAAAGVRIGTAGLSRGSTTVAIVIFVIIAASTIVVPVIGSIVASDAMRRPLDAVRGWLVRNNATVTSVLLLVIGVVLIGNGIARF